MLEERDRRERSRVRLRVPGIPRFADLYTDAVRSASIPVVDDAMPCIDAIDPLQHDEIIYQRTWLVSGVVGQGEEPLDDPIAIRAPHTSIVIDAPADRQCQLCGWYFALGRSPETIRHFVQCPLYNPNGIDE